jgi:pimeloyl-ACP methyl ester carboxylesterase
MRFLRLIVIAALTFAGNCALAQDEASDDRDAVNDRDTVKAIANSTMTIGTLGTLPLYVSTDWSKPSPGITRAVVMVHGIKRNAYGYFRGAETARAAAGQIGEASIVIAPQFLVEADVREHGLPPDTLRWSGGRWDDGEPAEGPSSASSFDALDAILAHLADRRLFPDMKQVVVAGHSGGGQMVQRYAIGVRGEAALNRQGIAVRYVVANPSSYAYFDWQRPEPSIAESCPKYNKWKYGMERRPPYLAKSTADELERRYVSRQVIYLLGALDVDPDHAQLDKKCMAEAQGPTRYARGHSYARAMAARHNGTPNHRVWDVPGVGHDGPKMFTSPCGIEALFDVAAGCATQTPPRRTSEPEVGTRH